jgi:transposase InsO family protein
MDFKGHYRLGKSERCHPLTVLDDHSRYALCLQACRNEQTQTVQQHLTATFRRYGLPERMLMDNGSPWGGATEHGYTPLTVWLLRLGIAISHSRPFHP